MNGCINPFSQEVLPPDAVGGLGRYDRGLRSGGAGFF
jgi:hypothetical protein